MNMKELPQIAERASSKARSTVAMRGVCTDGGFAATRFLLREAFRDTPRLGRI